MGAGCEDEGRVWPRGLEGIIDAGGGYQQFYGGVWLRV
jgi:hypothetical protein